jgi:multisubunit Na+/H+ antiporter MnhB subunit
VNRENLLILDGLLLISLVSLAWAALASADARRSVILFMAFGLVLAVAWARLLAPDVALAEAAIGAGLSGALLLAAAQEQPHRALPTHTASAANANDRHPNRALQSTITILCAALGATLAWALAHVLNDAPVDTLAQAVGAHLATSGVTNPVTAVLLNFRAYDTLLELAVLLSAVLGIVALGPARAGYECAGPVFDSLTRWLLPVLILTAGYLLWVGAHAPGGAFQAGATLAAAGVVLRLAGRSHIGLPHGGTLRVLLAAGVGIFLLVGLALLVLGRPFLGYPPAWAGALILLIESAAMLAIAATLVLAFIGGQPQSIVVSAGRADPTAPLPRAVWMSAPEPGSPEGLPGSASQASKSGDGPHMENRPC